MDAQQRSLDFVRGTAEKVLSAGTILILGIAVFPVKATQDPILWGNWALAIFSVYLLLAIFAILAFRPCKTSRTGGPNELFSLLAHKEPDARRKLIAAMRKVHSDTEMLLNRRGALAEIAFGLLVAEVVVIGVMLILRFES
jgi:hypothetical protein